MSIQAVAWALEQDVQDPAAKLVLLSLANAYNQQRRRCFPTVRQIMKEAGISEMGARRKLKLLVEAGLLRIEPAFDETGRQLANEYVLATFGEGTKLIGGGYQPDRGEGTRADRGEGTGCGTPLKEPEEIPEEGSLGASAPKAMVAPTTKSKAEKQAEDDPFEAFWDAYPKREGPNPKKPARLAFDRALKRGLTIDEMMAAVQRLAKAHPKPTRFCPQAVTWLNQDRAADDARSAPKPEAETAEVWAQRLKYARAAECWWPEDWGPWPGDAGCRVPADMLRAEDGRGWRERRRAS